MARKGTNIYKRKDGRWEGRFTKGFDGNGKRRWGYVYGRTYKEALQKKNDAMAKYHRTQARENMPQFQEIACEWFAAKVISLKHSSIQKYSSLLNGHILPELGAVYCGEFCTELLNSFFTKKLKEGKGRGKKGLSISTVRAIYSMICEIAQYAGKVRKILIDTSQTVIRKGLSYRKETFSAGDVEKMKSAAEKECAEEPRSFGVLLGLYTGLRVGELCSLRWGNINLKERMVTVSSTMQRLSAGCADDCKGEGGGKKRKTKLCQGSPKTDHSNRQIPICQSLFEILKDFKPLHTDNDYLLSGSAKKCVEPRNFQYYFKRFQKRQGIMYRNCHVLRHTFASAGIAGGMDAKVLSEILGHASVNITLNCYVHASMEQKRREIERIGNA